MMASTKDVGLKSAKNGDGGSALLYAGTFQPQRPRYRFGEGKPL
jgi:hypothetical protein